MNALDYAFACRNSYGNAFAWSAGWNISGVQVYLTTIANDWVLVFRGSQDALDWSRDLDAIPYKDNTLGWVDSGFFNGLQDVYKQLFRVGKGQPVSFTGHSLGGARARLMAGLFIKNGLEVKNLVTFGSPKPAFQGLADIITNSSLIHCSYRNSNDIVPTVPLTIDPLFDYVHTEQYIQLGDGSGVPCIEDHHINNYVKALQT